MADQTREEKRRARFHDEPASAEHKADLGFGIYNPNGSRKAHGDTHADSGSLDCRNGGLRAVMDRKGRSPSAAVYQHQNSTSLLMFSYPSR